MTNLIQKAWRQNIFNSQIKAQKEVREWLSSIAWNDICRDGLTAINPMFEKIDTGVNILKCIGTKRLGIDAMKILDQHPEDQQNNS